MLDDYKETQKDAYLTIKNALNKHHLSHAYLFETKFVNDKMSFAKAVSKAILCNQKYSNSQNCLNCSQCEKIDKNCYSELKIIEPDGAWIKKEQLTELQNQFNRKGIESSNRVYIIKEADKLNLAAANSLLKFLEEPEEGIVAILLVDNIYKLLPTIISRCQIIRLKPENGITIEKSQKEENLIDSAVKFVDFYEKNKLNTILYIDSIWFDNIESKDMEYAFDVIITYYKDILNWKLGRNLINFQDKINLIEKYDLSEKNIINKINLILDAKQKLKINVNSKLMMDKLVIDLERVDSND